VRFVCAVAQKATEGSNPSLTATDFPICDFRLRVLAPARDRARNRSQNRELLLLPLANRCEGVLENVIGHAATKGDSFCFIKGPVDAEIDSTLAVLVLGL